MWTYCCNDAQRTILDTSYVADEKKLSAVETGEPRLVLVLYQSCNVLYTLQYLFCNIHPTKSIQHTV